MVRRTHRLLLVVAVASALLAGCPDAVAGSCAALAHLLPFAIVILPLLAGRFVGEERLARLANRLVVCRKRRSVRACPIRRGARAVPRGGRLIASFLAVRPPPVAARCTS